MAVVEQQETEWTLRGKKKELECFYNSISHESTFLMQDKPNKYIDYLSTTARLGINQRSRLYPDAEKNVSERAGSSFFGVTPPNKSFVSKTGQAIKDTLPPPICYISGLTTHIFLILLPHTHNKIIEEIIPMLLQEKQLAGYKICFEITCLKIIPSRFSISWALLFDTTGNLTWSKIQTIPRCLTSNAFN